MYNVISDRILDRLNKEGGPTKNLLHKKGAQSNKDSDLSSSVQLDSKIVGQPSPIRQLERLNSQEDSLSMNLEQ